MKSRPLTTQRPRSQPGLPGPRAPEAAQRQRPPQCPPVPFAPLSSLRLPPPLPRHGRCNRPQAGLSSAAAWDALARRLSGIMPAHCSLLTTPHPIPFFVPCTALLRDQHHLSSQPSSAAQPNLPISSHSTNAHHPTDFRAVTSFLQVDAINFPPVVLACHVNHEASKDNPALAHH